ncbi:MAG: 16S rRNA (cytidine(1402)-2'-O)-methyltransferase [Eubacteriales bacterium]|nr:16S rRNA (cytidine(1402)-2'-O)-methyltransferase [Eubacteriales bacterium]
MDERRRDNLERCQRRLAELLERETLEPKVLYLVATPIGNLADLSPRALAHLIAADVIACEDTRVTEQLLSSYGIEGKHLIANHAHNEMEVAARLIERLDRGERLVLVSDAGMPLISDPGQAAIAACVKAGYRIVCVPGPSASLTALALAGLDASCFSFRGFLPAKNKRRREMERLLTEPATSIVYEAPQRILRLLQGLCELGGSSRQACVCRELTKKFEESQRGTLAELVKIYENRNLRGECVLILEGRLAYEKRNPLKMEGYDLSAVNETAVEYIQKQLQLGLSVRSIVVAARERFPRLNKRQLTQMANAMKDERDGIEDVEAEE